MNVTELARKLKMPTKDLLQVLPQVGFDIGQNAIKINDALAERIIKEWPQKMRELRAKLEAESSSKESETKEALEEIKEIKIPPAIAVKELASRMELPVTKVLAELMKNGILSAQNEKVDFETATIVAEDMGFKTIPEDEGGKSEENISDRLKETLSKDKNLEYRAPVVVVMGHVDHGKTKLLDAIRQTNVVEGEAGGITQHIGAYQAEKKNKKVTFIDTPGHEAFTAMRSRGAKVADVAILVVAADDGVKPQTKEAVDIIKAAGLPMLVAINKIDKDEANIDKVKGELAELGLTPEDWGGKTICQPVSAKQNQNIDDLLDMVLLVADMEKENIKANPQGEVAGTIIESHVDKGAGPVATILVQNGTLEVGHFLSINNALYGKIKAMKDWQGNTIEKAGPSTPVQILGFKNAPFVGDLVYGTDNSSGLDRKMVRRKSPDKIQVVTRKKKKEIKTYNLIIKADVLGSLEAILTSLEKINHPEISIDIVSSGLGAITEADVLQAEASGADILGFHVKASHGAEDLAQDKKVDIKYFSIIYKLLEDVTEKLETLLGEEIIEKTMGCLKVLAIFKTTKDGQIVGGKVEEGKIFLESKLKIFRNDTQIGEGSINELQSGKVDVKEAVMGEECGINFKGNTTIEEGDILESFIEERQQQKIQ